MSYKPYTTKLIEEYTKSDKTKVTEAASDAVMHLDALSKWLWITKQDNEGIYLEPAGSPDKTIRVKLSTDGQVIYEYNNRVQCTSIKVIIYAEGLNNKEK